jgi:MFS family permease
MIPAPQEENAPGIDVAVKGANWSLALLLAINLFNYVDRQVLAAVEVSIEKTFHVSQAKMGWAATVFLLSYMVIAPIFGFMADRVSRWLLVGIGVLLWSLASGGTGLAATFGILLLTRCFVGVGEAAYGPVAPTILSDLYPVKMRGQIMSWFYLAIPVGSALGYVLGGAIATKYGWRAAFYAVVPPGLLLGALALFMKDPRRGASEPAPIRKPSFADYTVLLKTKSYVINTLGMAAMTFAIGGIGFWMPRYIFVYRGYGTLAHVNSTFGAITVVSGLFATLLGGWAGDRFRKKHGGAYFLVSGAAMLLGFPLLLATLHTPFPYAWILVFLSVFCLFFNTGPTNAILANVTHPAIRATGFALNIFVIHLLGDAVSPPLIGWMSDRWGMNTAFTVVSIMILIGGILWLYGAKFLEEDTRRAPGRLAA